MLLVRPPDPGRLARWVHLATQAGLLVLLPWGLVRVGQEDLHLRRLPGRSNAWYFLCPVKSFEAGPERYARALLAAAPPGAVVLADFNPGAVLCLVQQQARLRPDVQVVATAVDDALGTRDPAAALQGRIAEAEEAGAAGGAGRQLGGLLPSGRASKAIRSRACDRCGPGWLVRTKHEGHSEAPLRAGTSFGRAGDICGVVAVDDRRIGLLRASAVTDAR